MFTEIDGRSLRTAEEERIEREKELKRTEFQRKKSFFESESATEHSSTTTENKSGSDGSVNINWIRFFLFCSGIVMGSGTRKPGGKPDFFGTQTQLLLPD